MDVFCPPPEGLVSGRVKLDGSALDVRVAVLLLLADDEVEDESC